MTESDLKFLLDLAVFDSPVQRSYFEEHCDLDFDWLVSRGFLKRTGRISGKLLVHGKPHEYFRNGLARIGSGYYYWDEDEALPFNPDLLEEFAVDYTPFAMALIKHLKCYPTPEVIFENKVWNLGAPDTSGAEVYLVRNAGTDSQVRTYLASDEISGDMTIYCFGTLPNRKDTKARVSRLADYLKCENGDVVHKAMPPQSITDAEGVALSACGNRIIHRGKGKTWDFWYHGAGPHPISNCIGSEYLAKIIQAGTEGIHILKLIGGQGIGNLDMSMEDLKAHGMSPELAIRAMDKKSRELCERVKEQLILDIEEAQAEENDNAVRAKKKQLEIVTKLLNGQRSFKDGFTSLAHLVGEAIRTALCNNLTKEGIPELADVIHERKALVCGVNCRFQPQSPEEWDIRL